MELEYPTLEEISKQESSKLLYAITYSKPKNQKNKNKIYDRINSGIQGVTKNKSLFEKRKMFEATENNIVIMNFLEEKYYLKKSMNFSLDLRL